MRTDRSCRYEPGCAGTGYSMGSSTRFSNRSCGLPLQADDPIEISVIETLASNIRTHPTATLRDGIGSPGYRWLLLYILDGCKGPLSRHHLV